MALTAAERDLTATERRTLEAVRGGKASRTYYSRGNTLKGDGVSSAVLRRLQLAGLIADKRPHSGAKVPQVLTMRGERALNRGVPAVTELTQEEGALLKWLAREDYSQYGECHGRHLDALIAKGFAQLHGDGGELGPFIAKGKGPMYQSVSVTDAGHTALREQQRPIKLRDIPPGDPGWPTDV